MTKLTIIRGLPGSGKSTTAKKIAEETGAKHFEADMFFIDEHGEYNFRPHQIRWAHHWCQAKVACWLDAKNVVVSNTFTMRWEMEPYFEMANIYGADVEVIVANGNWPNIHGVPQDVIDRMRERWEE